MSSSSSGNSSDSDSSPPPPPSPDSSDSSSSSPPPPDSNSSPPPPQDSNNSKSPPPPDSNSGSDQSPPPPPPSSNDNDNKSPPPPSSSSSNGGSQSSYPPPPPPPPPPPSPPPLHSGSLSPPKHKSSPSSKHNNSSSSNGKGTIIVVVAGALLLLLIMVALVFCLCKKKKRKHKTGYYMDNSNGPHGDYFTSGQQQINWSSPMKPSENLYRMPPSGQVSSEQGWPIAPPPPPPMMSSSEMSSAAFSGPVNPPPLPPPHPAMALGFNQSSFTYEDLAAATGGFSHSNLLGQGGFGFVHKGVLPNGKEVAVKSLKANSGQGEREFQAEVEIISRVHHRHLVSLVGYCIAEAQRMLVYEFVPNNTLEYHLYGKGRPVMDFSTRLKIAIGSARGLAYLHEDCHPRIIHRDIKAANILIDFNFEAKVADFGLAKLSSDTNTHVSTRIMGTFGYLAPEYAASGKLTEKSDVFSYGVMLLELIAGKRPVDVNEDESLVDWARPILMHAAEGGSYEEIVDPLLEGKYDADEMLRMVSCAGASIKHSARRRPKMSQIVRALEGDVSLEDLHGFKPGQSPATGGGSDYDSFQMDLRKQNRSGMSSQEFTSGEHGLTGEFSTESHEPHPVVAQRPTPP